jgi:hypothetical protein
MAGMSDTSLPSMATHERGRSVMAYMLLIVEPQGQRSTRTDAEGRDLYDRMVRFSEELKQQGLLTISQSLKSDTIGSRVRLRGDSAIVTDGPFAETKEVIGGFFLLTCETREEAIEIARRCPAAEWATVEVRELGPCFQ